MTPNDLYEATDKKKKSPGQWLQSKDIKNLAKELGSDPKKKDNGEWSFCELLLAHYNLYLHPKQILQRPKQAAPDDLSDVAMECKREFLEWVSGISYSTLTKCAKPEEIFEALPDDVKIHYKSFAYQFKTKVLSVQRMEERAREYAKKNLISTLRLNIEPTQKLFQNDKCIITFRKTRLL